MIRADETYRLAKLFQIVQEILDWLPLRKREKSSLSSSTCDVKVPVNLKAYFCFQLLRMCSMNFNTVLWDKKVAACYFFYPVAYNQFVNVLLNLVQFFSGRWLLWRLFDLTKKVTQTLTGYSFSMVCLDMWPSVLAVVNVSERGSHFYTHYNIITLALNAFWQINNALSKI